VAGTHSLHTKDAAKRANARGLTVYFRQGGTISRQPAGTALNAA
jgi:hypothetical protein